MEEKNNTHIPNVIRFVILHFAGFSVFYVGFSYTALFFFLSFYLIRFLGVSLSYHRYFSHRSFKTSRLFQFILGLIGTTSGQRGPLWWAAGHRKHHRYSDKKNDVHSPHHNALWFSHIGWVLKKESLLTDFSQVKDFEEYPELKWLNKNNSIGVGVSLVFLFAIGTFLQSYYPSLETSGLQLVVWGGVLSILLCCHSVLALNSICHIAGGKAYPTKDKSTNVWWLAPFLLGEQYHNNHHFYPSSHTAAFEWYEFDQVGLLIRLLEKAGLVWDVKKIEQQRALSSRITSEKNETVFFPLNN